MTASPATGRPAGATSAASPAGAFLGTTGFPGVIGPGVPGAADTSSAGSTRPPRQPRAPGTPFRGFARPGPSGPSPLTLVAASLAVLLVLSAAVFGVRQLMTGSADSTPGVALTELDTPAGTGATEPTPSPTDDAAEEVPRTGANKKVKLGVFVGTSPARARAFGDWLGRDPDYAIDFSTRSTWEDIANPEYMLGQWRGTEYRMVYSIALLPWNGDASIKAGSKGDYDEHFRRLARNLVASGHEDAILRLGWEFNLKGWKWSTKNPDEFIAYWRSIVTAMRSVPGEKLQFDWNPNVGKTPYDATLYYPGNKYVDYVGVDVYDVSWDKDTYPYSADCNATCRRFRQEEVWERLLHGHHGLAFWSGFARSKDKPMSLPEWGLWERPDGHGGGDNPFFIKQMYAFIDDPRNRVAYQGYLQVDVADGQHKLTTLPKAGKAFKRLFVK